MTNSYTLTATETFSLSHAKRIASKVATDLQRFQRFYGSPSDSVIAGYEGEMVELLRHDVVDCVVYGFQRNGLWTGASVKYKAIAGNLSCDDDPGKILPRLDVSTADFTSFLEYNAKWLAKSPEDQQAIRKLCPIQRTTGRSPSLEKGVWVDDLQYSAAGRGLSRSTVRL